MWIVWICGGCVGIWQLSMLACFQHSLGHVWRFSVLLLVAGWVLSASCGVMTDISDSTHVTITPPDWHTWLIIITIINTPGCHLVWYSCSLKSSILWSSYSEQTIQYIMTAKSLITTGSPTCAYPSSDPHLIFTSAVEAQTQMDVLGWSWISPHVSKQKSGFNTEITKACILIFGAKQWC